MSEDAQVEVVKPSKKRKNEDDDEPVNKNISRIKNKMRRNEKWVKLKREKKAEKRARQDARKKEREALGDQAPPKQVPKTLDNTRLKDETTISTEEGQVDEEVTTDMNMDEFSSYFEKSYEPKILMTCGDKPSSRTIKFCKEFASIIPNAEPKWRNNSSIKKLVKECIERDYTDIIIVNEDRKKPNGVVVCHLPNGPTALFKLTNVKTSKEINKDWRSITSHRPEVILNNFTTRLGHGIARMMASLFHYDPQFQGKRVVTFHNQRDYIFFRHHKYHFKSAEKCRLHELGPRFTLKLRSLQQGTFDSKEGDYEWMITDKRHDMEESRKRFYL